MQLVKYGVMQSLVLGPILFIVFINDFRKAVEFSSVHHFANDTNLLLVDKLLKNINNHINRDLKLTINRVIANKLSPSTIKTEIVIFKPGNSEPPNILTFTLAAKKLNHSEDEALRLINFQPLNAPARSLYQKNNFLTITDFINYKNIIFIRNSLRKENLPIFNKMLIKC